MLCGAPGSGKSKLAEKLANDISEAGSECVVISTELIREEITGSQTDQSMNKEVFEVVHQRIRESLENDINVIYDATNANHPSRRKIMYEVKRSMPYDGKIICLLFSTTLSQCLENVKTRGMDRWVPEEITERMYVNLQKYPPSMSEGYDMIIRV